MKVLHCITCIDDAGGAEKLMEDLLPGLQQEGCQVDCVVLNGFASKNRSSLEAKGIHVYELSRNSCYYHPMKTIRLLPLMRKYDIIHAHNTPATVHTAIAGLFCKTKKVMTEHNTKLRMRHIWGLKQFDKWVHNRYDSIICCSKAVQENLEKEVHLKKPSVLTVNNGVKLQKFFDAIPSTELSKMDCKKIVMVAWFRNQKQHNTVIEAVQKLPLQFHAFLVGEGDTLDENKAYAQKLCVAERVHFLGMRTDVPAILKAADYIVLSSHYVGLSLSSIEGMAVGKPFIGSNVDGLREIVGGAGVLFEEQNAEELASIIQRLDNDPMLYCEIANKCYKRALQYDMSSMVIGYKQVYERLLN